MAVISSEYTTQDNDLRDKSVSLIRTTFVFSTIRATLLLSLSRTDFRNLDEKLNGFFEEAHVLIDDDLRREIVRSLGQFRVFRWIIER